MNDVQKSGIVLSIVGLVLILARIVGIAHGQQYAIGGAFILAGGAVYLLAGRSS